jgi:hypothetical protein
VTQVVECLLRKREALNSNPSPIKKQKRSNKELIIILNLPIMLKNFTNLKDISLGQMQSHLFQEAFVFILAYVYFSLFHLCC